LPSARSALAVFCLAVAVAGCGAGAKARPGFTESSVGSGAYRVWVFRPARKPTSVVVFVHGQGDLKETTPAYHRPWLEHLARNGSIVLYPKYELTPGAPGAVVHMALGLRAAAARLHLAGLPTLGIGYSRGGWLVFAYATVAKVSGLRLNGILSVFPVSPEVPSALRRIPPGTRIDVVAGDMDRRVGKIGAAQILTLLGYAGYPHSLTTAKLVRSHGDFKATHLSVFETSAAARTAFWNRADDLLDELRSRSARS
jgi:acetyl esterase/lipase